MSQIGRMNMAIFNIRFNRQTTNNIFCKMLAANGGIDDLESFENLKYKELDRFPLNYNSASVPNTALFIISHSSLSNNLSSTAAVFPKVNPFQHNFDPSNWLSSVFLTLTPIMSAENSVYITLQYLRTVNEQRKYVGCPPFED